MSEPTCRHQHQRVINHANGDNHQCCLVCRRSLGVVLDDEQADGFSEPNPLVVVVHEEVIDP